MRWRWRLPTVGLGRFQQPVSVGQIGNAFRFQALPILVNAQIVPGASICERQVFINPRQPLAVLHSLPLHIQQPPNANRLVELTPVLP